MTAFRPGDRVHMWQNAWLASTTGTVTGTTPEGRTLVRWDDNQAVTSHLPQHLEPAGEPMTTAFKSNVSNRTIEVTSASMRSVGFILSDDSSLDITIAKTDAPALALAVLEAAGVKACAKEFGATAGTMAQLEDIAWALADYSNAKALEAEQAADREALEGEALELFNALREANDNNLVDGFHDIPASYQGTWLAVAMTSRTMHGVTK